MKKILIAILCSIFYGCDIPGKILVNNPTAKKHEITMYFKDFYEKRDTIKLEIPPKESKGILFGFGYLWSDKTIKDCFEKIEIKSDADTTIISKEDELFYYLKKRRKGLFKDVIKINI